MNKSTNGDKGVSPSGLIPSFSGLAVSATMGSSPSGRLTARVQCAAYSAGTPAEECNRSGIHLCSQCRMLQYCSKACQAAHWPKHKIDCKSPYMKSSWTTDWFLEGRSPHFMLESDPIDEAPGFGHAFHYVWGNLPAMDVLNVPNNEGDSIAKMDLNLAFAASGDLRNMMATINGLPEHYSGRCRVLSNDLDVTVAGRNAAILLILLADPDLDIEEAAELCVHLQYSAVLTKEQATYVHGRLMKLFVHGSVSSHIGTRACVKEIPLRGRGTLYLSFSDLQVIIDMITSRYSLDEAIKSMHAIVLAPSRKDYLQRYLFAIRGPHRVGDMHLRKTGVLLPFSAQTSHFTEPNRLLFTHDGRWLSPDSASQLNGWDPREVVATGKRHGCSENDVKGCLFFHVKEVFMKFAKRAEQFGLDIHITNTSAQVLPALIQQRLGSLRHFSTTFDRVETSNVMDYLDVGSLVDGWAPMLNRANKHATLLLSTMNWVMRCEGARAHSLAGNRSKRMGEMLERCATYHSFDIRVVAQRSNNTDPRFVSILQNLDSFHDNTAAFQSFIGRLRLQDVAKRHGLVLRTTNSILPRGVGWPMTSCPKTMPPYSKEDWYMFTCLGGIHGTERFLEMKVA